MSERTDATGTSDGAAETTTTPPTPSRPRPTLRELMRRYPWVAATITVAIVGLALQLIPDIGGTLTAWLVSLYCLTVAAVQAWGMIRKLMSGAVGLDILAITAIVSTVAIGDYWASLVVVLMLTGGEALEDYANARARSEVSALLDRTPRTAHRVTPADAGGTSGTGTVTEIDVNDVNVGDLLLVGPGETVPVDGTLADDEAELDESSLTGESLPVSHVRGSAVLSGSVAGDRPIHVQATARAADSQYQQIVALVQSASDSKAPFVRLADRYSIPFTIVAFLIAGIAWWVSKDPTRFAEVLVVATPCPLLIAAPVAFIGGMSRAAHENIVVKSGGTLEQLAQITSVAFDKTGTLTYGRPEVDHVEASAAFSESDIVRYAASAEQSSPHVLARAITAHAGTADLLPASDVEESSGNGVTATVDGHRVQVGKQSWIVTDAPAPDISALEPGQMAVYVAVDSAPAGRIVLTDHVRDNAADTLQRLRDLGIDHTVMLTGDAQATAEHIAAPLGITHVEANLLPADKVRAVSAITDRPVMMVGDGVNDAPVLAAADVGVAMGAKGSTAASQSADVVIMVDDLGRVPTSITIARRTVHIALQSIGIGISLSIILMLIAAFGVIPAIIGAALQEAVDLVSILNSLRAARAPRGKEQNKTRAASTSGAAGTGTGTGTDATDRQHA